MGLGSWARGECEKAAPLPATGDAARKQYKGRSSEGPRPGAMRRGKTALEGKYDAGREEGRLRLVGTKLATAFGGPVKVGLGFG